MPDIQAHVIVSGRVQGVFFRSGTEDMANELGLKGWVRNLPDGRVEAVFEGDEKKVRKMVEWCRKGPRFANVTGVEVEFKKVDGEFNDFKIQY